jgi:hypothetical protein
MVRWSTRERAKGQTCFRDKLALETMTLNLMIQTPPLRSHLSTWLHGGLSFQHMNFGDTSKHIHCWIWFANILLRGLRLCSWRMLICSFPSLCLVLLAHWLSFKVFPQLLSSERNCRELLSSAPEAFDRIHQWVIWSSVLWSRLLIINLFNR